VLLVSLPFVSQVLLVPVPELVQELLVPLPMQAQSVLLAETPPLRNVDKGSISGFSKLIVFHLLSKQLRLTKTELILRQNSKPAGSHKGSGK